MSYGAIAPYIRRRFGEAQGFATGSLLFDLERITRRNDAGPARPGASGRSDRSNG